MTNNKNNLCDELKSQEYIYTVNLAFKFGLYGGLRAEEICTLQPSSISEPYIDQKVAIVDITVKGKGHKERIVPILYAHIKKEFDFFKTIRKPNEPLFHQIKGGKLTRHSLYNYFSDITKCANVKSRGIHILRHTCAMQMRENGIDLGDAQDFLGHSDPSVTRVYYKKSQSRMRKVAVSFK